jgi:RNA recognition motif-containing protein
MTGRLFVANIPFAASEEELRELFEECGEVAAVKIIVNKDTGSSRGFGYVEMSTMPQAQKAVDKLNETDFLGRKLHVTVAEPRR